MDTLWFTYPINAQYYQYLIEEAEKYRRLRAMGMPSLVWGRLAQLLLFLARVFHFTGDKLAAYDRSRAPEWVDPNAPLPPILIGPFSRDWRSSSARAQVVTMDNPTSQLDPKPKRIIQPSFQTAQSEANSTTRIANSHTFSEIASHQPGRSVTKQAHQAIQPGQGVVEIVVATSDQTPWMPDLAEQLMHGLYQIGYFTCFIEADANQILFGFDVPSWAVDTCEEMITSLYDDVQILSIQPKTSNMIGAYQFPLEASSPFVLPLRYVGEVKNDAMLARVVKAMGSVGSGEQMRYELRFSPLAEDYLTTAENMMTESGIKWQQGSGVAGTVAVMRAKSGGQDRVFKPEYEGSDIDLSVDKLSRTLLDTKLVVKIKAAQRSRAEGIFYSLISGTNLLSGPGWNMVRPADDRTQPLWLSSIEASSLFHLPSLHCAGTRQVVWADINRNRPIAEVVGVHDTLYEAPPQVDQIKDHASMDDLAAALSGNTQFESKT